MSTTDDHIAAVFAELGRIGVEPDTVGAPLVATGFTRRSLLEWLQRIPSGVGAHDLATRLGDHARRALELSERDGIGVEDDTTTATAGDRESGERWWPSTLMLDAGIEVLAEEWDPVGLRLGSLPAADLGEYAFHLFGPLLPGWGGSSALTEVAGMIASIEEVELGLRPSPFIHRRYLAARLREIVVRNPLPTRRLPAPTASSVMSGDVPNAAAPPLDRDGVCSRCRRFGTIARVPVQSDPPRNVSFCAACWGVVRSVYTSTADPKNPETAHERIARLDESNEPPLSAESRSWGDTVYFLRLVLTARDDPARGAAITPALLAELASEIAADAHKMDGPMPDEIDLFLREFAPTR